MKSFKDFIINESTKNKNADIYEKILDAMEKLIANPMNQGGHWTDEDTLSIYIFDDFEDEYGEDFLRDNMDEIIKAAKKKWKTYRIKGNLIFSMGDSKEKIMRDIKEQYLY